MDEQNRRLRFAFHFDLAEAKLKERYPSESATGYKQAWADIRSFLEANGFTHTQYSGYESVEPMTYFDAYNILDNLQDQFSWFQPCAQGATLTEIGERYDVLEYLRAQTVDHRAMPEKALQSDAPGVPQSREDVAKSIAEAVKVKLEERKSKGKPSPDRGKKRPSR
ncbi:hypothetical protein [Mobiluncus curtisii]|uniref:Virulence-associated protein D (VapD) conserved region n=2 Tax=Mobiluncus curtisii TaxID=2051 RepID=D6ZI31_MOBCV|nr:hypothetical protein [Mobiluncus curtisii]ADI66380.1 Virulence-associated protein D (VapD) conserved region [Mobiluncus curtisii ATCC 43063]QQU08088.1 hypothetical protein I6I85_06390 [Mobiluncus curtisii]SQB64286.1 Uncharacterised protein [Mobiluncus curtisii]